MTQAVSGWQKQEVTEKKPLGKRWTGSCYLDTAAKNSLDQVAELKGRIFLHKGADLGVQPLNRLEKTNI